MLPNRTGDANQSHTFFSSYLPDQQTADKAAVVFGGAFCGAIAITHAVTQFRAGNLRGAASATLYSVVPLAGLISQLSEIIQERNTPNK